MGYLDWFWDLKFLKGYRTFVARTLTLLLVAYQALSTSKWLLDMGVDLPDLNNAVFLAIVGYLQMMVKKWAQEHVD